MTKRFTGWHMAGILVLFFGTIIVVNITMATFATRTFGGTVVDNSYVASQKFNGWLEAAREQEKLGWDVDLSLDEERRVTVTVTVGGRPMAGVAVEGVAAHTLGREKELPLRFVPAAGGLLKSAQSLPAGRWHVQVRIVRGQDEARLMESLS